LVVELERHAAGVDRQLVLIEQASTPVRRRLRRELRAEVQMVESVSERLIRTTRSYSGAKPSQSSLVAIGERLDALDAAMADLARIERLSVGEAEQVMRQRGQLN
jgi:type II secretory pathway component PulF